jgi:SulP family sulfate permease
MQPETTAPRSSFRRELAGGLTAALISLPLSIGYGLFAFDPLGEKFAAHAIAAGLISAIVVPVCALLMGANSPAILSPRSVPTFLVNAMVLNFVSTGVLSATGDPNFTMALLFLIMVLSGLFQVAFAVLGMGSLAKYIPHPVIAGFQNGAAILLVASQIDVLLGVSSHVALLDLPAHIGSVQPLTLLIGIATIVLILQAKRVTTRIPAHVVGLTFCVTAYYALFAGGFQMSLGPIIGETQLSLPGPELLAEIATLVTNPASLQGYGLLIVLWAFSLAMVTSLDALLCLKVVEGVARQRMDSAGALVRLGIANTVAAGLAAIPSSVNLASSQANIAAGGRGRTSSIVSVVALVLFALAGGLFVALLPRVAIAAILTVTGISLFDRWTLQLLKRLFSGDQARRRMFLTDLLVIVLVAAVAVGVNLVLAVAIGFGVSVLSFVTRMSRSVVRRRYTAEAVSSRKTRDQATAESLARDGARIAVFELEGPVFFGTAERLVQALEDTARGGADCLILDLRRVNDMDSTGARMLVLVHDHLRRDGKELAVSNLPPGRITEYFREAGVLAALTRSRVFADTDQALEWAEDQLIARALGERARLEDFPLSSMTVFAGLDGEQLRAIRDLLELRSFAAGTDIFTQGSDSAEMYIIIRGSASVRIAIDGRETRLVTFAPGTVFGELALLDTEPRSATVRADTELACYALTRQLFEALTKSRPDAAIILLTNLGRELSSRLRLSNRIIYQLER